MTPRRLGSLLALLGLGLAASLPAAAQSLLGPNEWLPPGSDIGAAVSTRPQQILAVERAGGRPSFLVRLGELAFRSSEILGGNAARAGLSCDTCHPGGDTNTRFFVPGLSGKPGTVDVTNELWNRQADDGLDNPVSIPSLRGVGETAPYGFRGHFASLRDFTRRVIVVEFAGPEPPSVILDALVEYMDQLAPAQNPEMRPDGTLSNRASPAAQRGETLFAIHCAACHPPGTAFADGRSHDVGSGGPVDTPSLLGVSFSAPYFHDGRYDTLAEAVGHFDRRFDLHLRPRQTGDLVAYLKAISGDAAVEPVTFAGDLTRLSRFLAVLRTPLLDENASLSELISRMLRGELGRIDARFQLPDHAAARDTLAGWARQVAEIGRLAEQGGFPAARASLDRLTSDIAAHASKLADAAPTSLYDPAVLKAALANTPAQ